MCRAIPEPPGGPRTCGGLRGRGEAREWEAEAGGDERGPLGGHETCLAGVLSCWSATPIVTREGEAAESLVVPPCHMIEGVESKGRDG